jgi:hypothetical protein
MTGKSAQSSPTSEAALEKQLKHLYLRLSLIDNLIRSLEEYASFKMKTEARRQADRAA